MQAQQQVEELQAEIAENRADRLRQLKAHWQTARLVGDAVDLSRVDLAARRSRSRSRSKSRSRSRSRPRSPGEHDRELRERRELTPSPTPPKPSRGSEFAGSSARSPSSDGGGEDLVVEDLVGQFATAIMDQVSPSTPRTPPRNKMSEPASSLSPRAAAPAEGVEARLIQEFRGRCTKEQVQKALADAQGHGGRAKKKLNATMKGRPMQSPSAPSLVHESSTRPQPAPTASASPSSRRDAKQAGGERTPPPRPPPEPEPEPEQPVRAERDHTPDGVEEGIPASS